MAQKVINASDLRKEIVVILNKGKGKADHFSITSRRLREKLNNNGVTSTVGEFSSAINSLLGAKSIVLNWLVPEDDGIDVEICFPPVNK